MVKAARIEPGLERIAFECDPKIWLANSTSYAVPRQQRSRAALERIVTAAVELFGTKGFETTRVSEIAKAASVPIGSLYQRFSDKNAILKTVIDGYRAFRMTEIRDLCRSEEAQAFTPAEVVALHINIIFSAFQLDAGLLRLLERRRLDDAATHQDLSDANAEVAGLIADLLVAKLPDRDAADLRKRTFYVHNIIRGSVVWATLPEAGEFNPGLRASDAEYAKAAHEMALAYLELH